MIHRLPVFVVIALAFTQISLLIGCSRGIPDDLKKEALNSSGFSDIIEVQLCPGRLAAPDEPNIKYIVEVLVPNGYCVEIKPPTNGGFLHTKKGVTIVEPTRVSDCFRPVEKEPNSWKEDQSNPGDLFLQVAKREYLKTTYENRWQESGRQLMSFTFTYQFYPLISGPPTLGPFQGKIVEFLDPSDGKWKIVEREFSDRGLYEYLDWATKNRENH